LYGTAHSRTHVKVPSWASYARAQLSLFAVFNRQLNSEALEHFRQFGGIRADYGEAFQVTPRRGISGRMNRIAAPLDKKRKGALMVVSKVESLPV
jgi:hypothetical protein